MERSVVVVALVESNVVGGVDGKITVVDVVATQSGLEELGGVDGTVALQSKQGILCYSLTTLVLTPN